MESMCGRYTLTTPLEGLREVFLFEEQPNLEARYNIAPTQEAPVLRLDSRTGRRHLGLLRWGLIPSWAKDPAIGSRMINARSETIAEKPAFRTAFRQRRCLIPSDGFYEWKAAAKDAGPKAPKQPYVIRPAAPGPFAFAGLWESWIERGGDAAPRDPARIDSFTIITAEASETIRHLHHRMPVILGAEAHAAWLDPRASAEDLQSLLRQNPNRDFVATPVSTRVNAVRNDDSGLLKPVELPAPKPAEAASKAPIQGQLF